MASFEVDGSEDPAGRHSALGLPSETGGGS